MRDDMPVPGTTGDGEPDPYAVREAPPFASWNTGTFRRTPAGEPVRPATRTLLNTLAVLVSLLVLGVILGGGLPLTHAAHRIADAARPGTQSAPGPDQDAPTGDSNRTEITTQDVTTLLDGENTAIAANNEQAFTAVLDQGDPQLLTRGQQLFENLHRIPFTHAAYRFGGFETARTANDAGPLTTSVDVVFDHQIAGVDTAVTRETYQWILHRPSRGGPITVTTVEGSGYSDGYPEPWDNGPLTVISTPHVVTMADASTAARAAAWSQRAETAATQDIGLWKGPGGIATGFTVYFVPDHKTFVTGMGGGSGDVAGAVGFCMQAPADPEADTTPQTTAGSNIGSRIYIDTTSDSFAGGDALDQIRLLRHEMGHAMVNAFASAHNAAPLWVVEGFAEYLAWSDLSLQRYYVPPARTYVRSGKFDGTLPTDSEIYSSDEDTGVTNYHLSMLAIRCIAETYGTAKADAFVVAVYRDPTAAGLENAIHDATGLDLAGFQAVWTRYVKNNI